MLKFLPSSANRPAAQHLQNIELQPVTLRSKTPEPTPAKVAGDVANTLPAELFSIITADLSPTDLHAAMLVSRAWARGILQTPRWNAIANAVEQMTPEAAKMAAENVSHAAVQATTPLSPGTLRYSLAGVGVLLSAAAGMGYGLANHLRLKDANNHLCEPYANLPVQVWTKSSNGGGYSDYTVGGSYVGTYPTDAQAACKSAISAQVSAGGAVAIPFPNGFNSNWFAIKPSYIVPGQHHAWTGTQMAILAGAVVAPLAVALLIFTFVGRTSTQLQRNRHADALRVNNDLEAGHAAALARQHGAIGGKLLAPGMVLARHKQLVALAPGVHASMQKGHVKKLALFGPIFKAVDSATGSGIHQQFFAHAITLQNPVQIQTLLDQGALFDESQLARLANVSGIANTAAIQSLFDGQGHSTMGAQVVSHLPDSALITMVKYFELSAVRAFLAAAGESKKRFLKAQTPINRRTALHSVAFSGDAETFALLRHYGADLDAEDSLAATPRQLASLSESLRPLINSSATPLLVDVTTQA